MNTKTLTKKNIIIALAINFSLMAISYKLGFCLDYAIPCTLVGMGILAVGFFRNKVAHRFDH
ncbi:hypothetical protein [Pelagicoccus sp. SDUM812002]|uniref:hypothetical protein n=1 Tax=Pelagicoccus sp. SDUM812002 TaxID=3041266 RepID=UPI00280EF916|nr:hypothetical protein [Pelagicoccus sp. SDUM812002]MDQ8186019.1 hypothetical protein [Pelagicoccus sp. SDUM812002]